MARRKRKRDFAAEINLAYRGIAAAYRDAPLPSGQAYIWNWIDHVAEPVSVLLGGRKDCVFAHRARNAERKDSRAWVVTHRETGGRVANGMPSDVARAIVRELKGEHELLLHAIVGDRAARDTVTDVVRRRKLGDLWI